MVVPQGYRENLTTGSTQETRTHIKRITDRYTHSISAEQKTITGHIIRRPKSQETTTWSAAQLRRLVAGLSPRRPGIDFRPAQVDKAALGQTLVRVLRFIPVSLITPLLHTHSFIYHHIYLHIS